MAVQGAATNHTALYLEHDGGINTGAAMASQSASAPGTHFVGLFHPRGDDYPAPLPNMTISFARHFGLPVGTQCTVRDLWQRSDIGRFKDAWTVDFSIELDEFILDTLDSIGFFK